MSIRDASRRARAATGPDAPDARLRGRAYLLPFGTVWRVALSVAASLRGWTVVAADPNRGSIRAEARSLVWKFVDDVEIHLSLDASGLTRVDLTSTSRVGRVDFGTNARRIAHFLRRLDDALKRG